MKTSELIERLQRTVEGHGDLEVRLSCKDASTPEQIVISAPVHCEAVIIYPADYRGPAAGLEYRRIVRISDWRTTQDLQP